MKFFRDAANTVYAFEADGSQDAFIPEGLTSITREEADLLRALPAETWDQAHTRALTVLKSERAPILSVLDGLQGTAATKGLAALLAGETGAAASHSSAAQGIEQLKQALKDAPTAIDWASCAGFEEMRQAGKAYYASLVGGAPAEVRVAFREVV